jgi:polynucleotide 5'-kinase involved in rRNA processing
VSEVRNRCALLRNDEAGSEFGQIQSNQVKTWIQGDSNVTAKRSLQDSKQSDHIAAMEIGMKIDLNDRQLKNASAPSLVSPESASNRKSRSE